MPGRTVRATALTCCFVMGPALLGCKKSKDDRRQKSSSESSASKPAASTQRAANDWLCTISPAEAAEILGGCTSWGCGSNSPEVGAEGYSLAGDTDDGHYIASYDETWSATVQKGMPNDPEVYRLQVRDGAFVAEDSEGTEYAIDPSEALWWFEIRDEKERKCRVRITNVEKLPSWHKPERENVLAYTLTIKRGKDRSLCRERQSWGKKLDSTSDAAVLVPNEKYDPVQAEVEEAGVSQWFNIACAGSALAKMRLMGFDPEEHSEERDIAERTTILKMLTATYYIRRGSRFNWTTIGQPLGLAGTSERLGSFSFFPDEYKSKTTEAVWSDRGAKCFEHTRLFSKKDDGHDDRKHLEPACKRSASECEKAIRDGGDLPGSCADKEGFKTHAIDHQHTALL